MNKRMFREGRMAQGEDETIYYSFDTSLRGDAPTNVSAKIYTVTRALDGQVVYTDTTSTNMTGSATVNGNVITLPGITALLAGTLYRFECKYNIGANVFEEYGEIMGER